MDTFNDELWECDGCGLTGTSDEVEDHIRATNTLANGDLKDPADIVCWGAMQVGGEAWNAYHFEGVHPMSTVMAQVALKYWELMEGGEGGASS